MIGRVLLSSVAVLVLLAGLSTEAQAQARHERVKITPVKAKGQVVGARIKAVVRPEDGYKLVQLVIGKAKKPGQFDGKNYRAAAAGETKGYVIEKGQQKSVTGNAVPMELVLKFNKKNGLKPGDKVDLTSVWAKGANPSMSPGKADSLHVWGMSRNGQNREITLPAK
jgi:hypothetical protein